MDDLTDYDTIVLAGGAARRLGGADKPALSVGGRPLLDRVIAACPDAAITVVVGPRRPATRAVVHALEDPPGGGPLAALDAGLRHTTAPTRARPLRRPPVPDRRDRTEPPGSGDAHGRRRRAGRRFCAS